MSPALLNIALGVADKVVVQIDEPSEKLCPSSVWVYLVYLVLVKFRMDGKERVWYCETKMMREAT